MKNPDYLQLRNHLNNFVGEGYAYVPAWAPIIYGEVDREGQWAFVHATLAEWEAKGFLKVLKNPEHCTADELCIEMFNFIDAEKPLPPDWTPNKTRMPPKWPHPYAPGTVINRGHSIGDQTPPVFSSPVPPPLPLQEPLPPRLPFTFFPTHLNRVQYLIRLVLVTVISVSTILLIPFGDTVGAVEILTLLGLIALGCYALWWIHLPRVRSIGWHPLTLLLLVVPFVGFIFAVLLVSLPPEKDEPI